MKKKIVIISVLIIFIISVFIVGFYTYINYRDSKISLINDNVIIEYGESYSPNIEELIDIEQFNFINLEDVSIDNNIINNDEGYPEVGEYFINVYYNDLELIQKVKVQDTISPEIIIDEKIEVPYNTDLENYDFSTYIEIKDLSETEEYTIDFSNVNVEIAGEYIAIIEVKDIYGNEAQKEFTIVIQENTDDTPTEEISTSSQTKTNNNQSNNSSSTTQSSNTSDTTDNNSSQTATSNTQSSSTVSSSETTNSNESTSDGLDYWCIGGGSVHVAGDGANEHGYYSTWDEAYQAFLDYTSDWASVQFKISSCACGLYYFWAIQ